ncbi:hypothetical protein GDO78_008318 [Eleutherodactylus coqui]|uniref:Uncharacterized protein n=1 Tax=Eleutherodactylus coqui TaxID=57060 RepID=A0A8J6KAI7_ELECQ|nr:hypothetical protein GDO78_008318 [Eleutherodactylus coqui]
MAVAALLTPRTFLGPSMEFMFWNSKIIFFYPLENCICRNLTKSMFVPLIAAFEVFVYQNMSGLYQIEDFPITYNSKSSRQAKQQN